VGRSPSAARNRIFAGIVHRLGPLHKVVTVEGPEIGDRVESASLFHLGAHVDATSCADQKIRGFRCELIVDERVSVQDPESHFAFLIRRGKRAVPATKPALAGADRKLGEGESRAQRPSQVPAVTASVRFMHRQPPR
jgi:hypothetical protein